MAVKLPSMDLGASGAMLRPSLNRAHDIEVVAINDLGPVEQMRIFCALTCAWTLSAEVTTTDSTIDVGRGPIDVTAIRNPAELPGWYGCGFGIQAFSQIGTRSRFI